MKKFFATALTAICMMLIASTAMAYDIPPPRLGVGMDVGVPSGAALEVTLHPKSDWVRVSAALTYNYLSFGGRASLQLDPLAFLPKFPVGLYADVQGGFFPQASIPGHADLPQVGYDYLNLYGVLRFGTARSFHWNFMAGPSYLHITTGNFQSVLNNAGVSGLKVGNPTLDGWLVPTFATGFEVPITL